ncbi:hypothetical protein BYT27DRAFT_7204462 [Phlegmacium glaucopus]|nr:hypothetical protein BYT27DRAFT_7204462 [Phlegmacium glaucopus]
MSPTIYVQLPTLPPTTHALELEQQSHRLRSTRKLGAVPRITPLILDLDSKVDVMPKAPTLISPRTRATRRKGQIFHTQSSSVSSMESTESDYVFINKSDLQQPHSPRSSRRMSPNIKPVAHSKSGKSGNTHAKGLGPQVLTQPFLLRLRSLPVPPAASIKTATPPIYPSKLLSPVSSSFNMDTPTPSSRPGHVLTDIEKQRKLAKLTRTLGENVPPELVFHNTPPLQRSASMTVSRLRKSPSSSHKLSRSTALPIAETPAPQPQSARKPEKPLKQQSRPRSMTLTTKQALATHSAVDDTRGTKSLDHGPVPAYHTIDLPFEAAAFTVDPQATKQHDALSPEWGRRKEREWSGEWNVKDMEHRAKALRGLKAR